MLRVVPPPRALLACQDPLTRQRLERRIPPDMLDFETTTTDADALRRCELEFRPVVFTDSLDLVQKLRRRTGEREPFVVYVAAGEEAAAREAGLAAGADECV